MTDLYRPNVSQETANFVAYVQVAIQASMRRQGVTKDELARRTGVSRARIGRVFSENPVIPIDLLPKIFHALGERVDITSERLDVATPADGSPLAKKPDEPGMPLFGLLRRWYDMPFMDRIQLGRELSLIDDAECVGDAVELSRFILARAREKGSLALLAQRLEMAP